jgi:vacuolar-type H+-ATPase catalytic subunit A/Vma1
MWQDSASARYFKQAEADVIIMAACGERANEVVEIFTEFLN